MREFVFVSADFLQDPMLSAMCGGCIHGTSLLNDDLREMINMVLEIIRLMSKSDTEGTRTPAGRAQWISSPSPQPLGHSVCDKMERQDIKSDFV
jgi:hypothetical protein